MKYLLFGFTILALLSCNSQHDCSNYVEDTFKHDEQAVNLQRLGYEQEMAGNSDSAVYFYRLAIEQDESYYLPHSNIGEILLREKKYNLALAEYEEIVRIRPNMSEGHSGLGMLYDFLDQDEKANSEYEIAISLNTDRIECSKNESLIESSRIDRAVIYMLSGNEEKGKEELKDLKDSFEGKPKMQEWMDKLINLEKEEYLNEIFA